MANNHHGLLPKFTLIYSGVLLSLSLRLITDKLVSLLEEKDFSIIIHSIDPSLILAFITLLWFLDDIIENTMFISSYPYRGTMRFYFDISIASTYYLCILLAINETKFYLISFAIMSSFATMWSVLCKYRGTGPAEYLGFNRVAHTWGLISSILLFGFLLYNYNDIDTFIKYSLYFLLLWIICYNLARVIVLRNLKKKKCEGTEFLEAGLIMRLFIYAFYATTYENSQEGDEK